jgi:hypothetical protein
LPLEPPQQTGQMTGEPTATTFCDKSLASLYQRIVIGGCKLYSPGFCFNALCRNLRNAFREKETEVGTLRHTALHEQYFTLSSLLKLKFILSRH